jgi:6-pyruvoyltetrahydropterin/6-carboxytetrahydropterin synthase
MKDIIPSTELLAKGIWNEIHDVITKHGVQLHSVKLHETENNYVEYFGE